MKVFQIIKKLNNTELGKGNTNETYILIPKDLDVSDLFETSDREFTCKKSGMRYKLRITIGRETRIVGLGKFYRSNQLSAGDEIVLEKRSYENQTEFLIDSHKKDNSVIFQKLQQILHISPPLFPVFRPSAPPPAAAGPIRPVP